VGESLTETEELLGSIATQLMGGESITLGERKIPVKRIGSGRLRMVQFRLSGRTIEAIEQNPEKSSRWAELARQKHQVVQFLDVETHTYIGVSVDGKAREYANKGTDY
jgi:hypothetical protein